MTTKERMEQLLDEKDAVISELESKVEELTNREEANWEWCRHSNLKENLDDLPVPRLEMRWEKMSDDGYLQCWSYRLIYRHTLDHLVCVPLGETNTQGGRGIAPIHDGEIQTPFREGVHICNDANHLGIPAFVIVGGLIKRVCMKNGKCHQEPYIP